MAVDPLGNLPADTDIFLDANIFIYALGGQSQQGLDLLFRCAREEVCGVTTIEVINEVTHRYVVTSNPIHLLVKDTGPNVIAQSSQLIAGRNTTSAIAVGERVVGVVS